MSTYVLYNELSGNGTGKTKAEEVNKFLAGKELIYKALYSWVAGVPSGIKEPSIMTDVKPFVIAE